MAQIKADDMEWLTECLLNRTSMSVTDSSTIPLESLSGVVKAPSNEDPNMTVFKESCSQ